MGLTRSACPEGHVPTASSERDLKSDLWPSSSSNLIYAYDEWIPDVLEEMQDPDFNSMPIDDTSEDIRAPASFTL